MPVQEPALVQELAARRLALVQVWRWLLLRAWPISDTASDANAAQDGAHQPVETSESADE